jgi:hypothetical protein
MLPPLSDLMTVQEIRSLKFLPTSFPIPVQPLGLGLAIISYSEYFARGKAYRQRFRGMGVVIRRASEETEERGGWERF